MLLAITPLIYKTPNRLVLILTVLSVIIFGIAWQFIGKIKNILIICWLIISSLNLLNSIELFDYANYFNKERLFFNDPQIRLDIDRLQKEAMYLLYRLRGVIFSSEVYVYRWLSNTVNFWRIGNYYDSFGILGVVALVYGLREIYKRKKADKIIILLCLVVTGLVAGLSRYDVKSNGWYPLIALFLGIEIMGINKIPTRWFYILGDNYFLGSCRIGGQAIQIGFGSTTFVE